MVTTEIDNRIILKLSYVKGSVHSATTYTYVKGSVHSATTYTYPCPIETEFIYQQIKYEAINEDIFTFLAVQEPQQELPSVQSINQQVHPIKYKSQNTIHG